MPFSQIILNSIIRGSQLGLLALGVTMIFAVLRFANFANYCYPQRGLDVTYGSLEACVESAVNGIVCRKDKLWNWN